MTELLQMSVTFSSTGILRYSQNWLLIDCDDEIGKYYRHLHYISVYRTVKLSKPRAGSHITVVSKYDRPKVFNPNWGFREGEEVEFSYDIKALDDSLYTWMTVECPDADRLRDHLGLGNPHYPFHLTIGNTK